MLSGAASAATTACSSTRTSMWTGGGVPLRRRLLRQEHDADHAEARLLGRARDARDDRCSRADAAASSRLRVPPPLHRRLSDGRARRAGSPGHQCLSLVLDAVAPLHPRAGSEGARRPRLRLRHLPGRLPVEPRRREAPRRPDADRSRVARLARRLARGRGCRPAHALRAALRPAQRSPLPAPERSSRWGTAAVRSTARHAERYAGSDDDLLREHAEWALARLDERQNRSP